MTEEGVISPGSTLIIRFRAATHMGEGLGFYGLPVHSGPRFIIEDNCRSMGHPSALMGSVSLPHSPAFEGKRKHRAKVFGGGGGGV